jgi:hypothetical protein
MTSESRTMRDSALITARGAARASDADSRIRTWGRLSMERVSREKVRL